MSISIVFEPYKVVTKYDQSHCMMIMASDTDGPVRKPVLLDNIGFAINTFGDGNIVNAYKSAKALALGTTHVYGYRKNGRPARTIILDTNGNRALVLYHINGGAKYNNKIAAVVNNTTLKLYNYDNTLERTYTFTNFADLSSLAIAINYDCGQCGVSYTCELLGEATAAVSLAPNTYTLYYGDDTLDDDGEDPAWDSHYMLNEYPCGVYALADVYYGNTDTTTLGAIIEFAKLVYNRNVAGDPCVGVIGARPIGDNETIDDYVSDLSTFASNHGLSGLFVDNNMNDMGSYIVVVAGAGTVEDEMSTSDLNIASGVASVLLATDYNQSICTMPFAKISKNIYAFTNEHELTLNNAGINILKGSIRRNVVMGTQWTMYTSSNIYSDVSFKSLLSVRIGQKIVKDVVAQCSDFHGEMLTLITLSALKSKVAYTLNTLQTSGYVLQYAYTVTQIDDEIYIDISYVPVSDIRTVSLTVRI